MITVVLPSQLDSYTRGTRQVMLEFGQTGAPPTLGNVMDALDERFHGLKFRVIDEQDQIRRHIAIFVGETLVHALDTTLGENARVQIVGALSGG